MDADVIYIGDLQSSARDGGPSQHKCCEAIASRIGGNLVTSPAGRSLFATQRGPSVEVEASLGAVSKSKELRLSFAERHVVDVCAKTQVVLAFDHAQVGYIL